MHLHGALETSRSLSGTPKTIRSRTDAKVASICLIPFSLTHRITFPLVPYLTLSRSLLSEDKIVKMKT